MGVTFSIAGHAAWMPGIDTPQAWKAWAEAPFAVAHDIEPSLSHLPAMLRRRTGFLGKMALDVAYRCLNGRTDIPTVFCSRHGEVSRAVDLLTDLVNDLPISPTSFGLAVHNASTGILSIARADQANCLALAAGASTIEHGLIEACSLLADGAPTVLVVACDNRLPAPFTHFADCDEQPHAWAWLIEQAGTEHVQLNWSAIAEQSDPAPCAMPAGLDVLRFYLSGDRTLERVADRRRWTWVRHA